MANRKYLAVFETITKDNQTNQTEHSRVVLFSDIDRAEIERRAQQFINCKVTESGYTLVSEDSFDGYRIELHDTDKLIKHRLIIVEEII